MSSLDEAQLKAIMIDLKNKNTEEVLNDTVLANNIYDAYALCIDEGSEGHILTFKEIASLYIPEILEINQGAGEEVASRVAKRVYAEKISVALSYLYLENGWDLFLEELDKLLFENTTAKEKFIERIRSSEAYLDEVKELIIQERVKALTEYRNVRILQQTNERSRLTGAFRTLAQREEAGSIKYRLDFIIRLIELESTLVYPAGHKSAGKPDVQKILTIINKEFNTNLQLESLSSLRAKNPYYIALNEREITQVIYPDAFIKKLIELEKLHIISEGRYKGLPDLEKILELLIAAFPQFNTTTVRKLHKIRSHSRYEKLGGTPPKKFKYSNEFIKRLYELDKIYVHEKGSNAGKPDSHRIFEIIALEFPDETSQIEAKDLKSIRYDNVIYKSLRNPTES